MFNLEELHLCLVVFRKRRFIDGNELTRNILNDMIRLKKFTFNICSNLDLHDQTDLISSKDVQHTFKDIKDYHIISSVDYSSQAKEGRCYIYSYPYSLKYYDNITNHFSDGLFQYVSKISLFDEHPFEHEFFLRIAQSFPFIKKYL
jgi:hypothetical protein